MDSLVQDVRYAVRGLAARPGFSALLVLILTLGLGANVTLFSVLSSVLLKPLPFPESERLVRVYQAYPERQLERGSLSRLNAEDWVATAKTVSGLGLYSTLPSNLILTGREQPTELVTAHVSGGFFATLGARAEAGRVLGAADERGNDRVVVLSHRLFERRFGADPGLVGSTIELNGEPMTVAGVMPPSFRFPSSEIEVWALLSLVPERSIPRLRGVRFMNGVARLAPGATPAAAELELSSVARRLADEFPDSNAGATAVTVKPLLEEMVGGTRPALMALFAAMGLLLLIACTNVASLLLARGLSRQREIAVAQALGASRGRLVRRQMAETAVLALCGAAGALLVASWAGDWIAGWSSSLLPRAEEVGIDGRVWLFAAGAMVVTLLLSGLLPAWRLSGGAEAPLAVVRMGRRLDGRGQGRLQGALVATQVALALLLLSGAGLALTSLRRLTVVDPGFNPAPVLAVEVDLPDHKYPERGQYLLAYREMLAAVQAVAGVEAAGSIKQLRLGGSTEVFPLTVVGEPPPAPGAEPLADFFPVSQGFFTALGVPLLAGRDFAASDGAEAPLVGIVSRSMATKLFGDRDPLGRRLNLGRGTMEIIAVVGDVRHDGLAEDAPGVLYAHQEQIPRRVFTFVARSASGDPRALAGPVVAAIRAVDSDQAISRVMPLREQVRETLASPRLFSALAALFAGTALLLAACGLYGVVSFLAEERVPEIGLRMAVGAGRADVLRLIVGRGMRWAWVGSAAGLAALGLAARLLAAKLPELLFGVRAFEPATVVAALLVLLLAAGLASYVPARRASRLDPLVALKSEG